MKAFVHKIKDGKIQLGSGNATVTNNYGSLETMIKFGVIPWLKEGEVCLVESFNNWDKCYGTPDHAFILTKFSDIGSYSLRGAGLNI